MAQTKIRRLSLSDLTDEGPTQPPSSFSSHQATTFLSYSWIHDARSLVGLQSRMRCFPITFVKGGLEYLHNIKTEHQYLGRYSIEKLCAFHEYQQRTSIFRVIAVVLFTPVPTMITLWLLDCMPLRDPRGGAKHHATTFLRSMVSHAVMTYMFLMAGKQALGLTARNSAYSHTKVAKISLCVAVCLETYCVIVAFAWRFPTPFREFSGVPVWGTLTVIFNLVFAKRDLTRAFGRLKRYIPVVGTQLVLFYFLLLLSVGFAAVPLEAQIGLILAFPAVKLTIKRALWKYARNLDDISADVTICMVEISGSLYQTVCMQYVQNNLLALVIMILDFLQAAFEARTYMNQDYMGDSKSTLQTAMKIVESALFTGVAEKTTEVAARMEKRGTEIKAANGASVTPRPRKASGDALPKIRPIASKVKNSQSDMPFDIEPAYESFSDLVARLLRKGRAWRRRRQRRSSRRKQRYADDDKKAKSPNRQGKESTPRGQKLSRRDSANSPRGVANNGVNISREVATSVYINAKVIRRGKARRLLDFGQLHMIQNETPDEKDVDELPTAPPTTFIPRNSIALTHRGSLTDTNRGSGIDGAVINQGGISPTNRDSIPETNRGSVPETNRGSIPETHRGMGNRGSVTGSQAEPRGSLIDLRVSVTDMPVFDAGERLIRPMIRRKSSMSSTKLLKRKSSRSVVPSLGALGRRTSMNASSSFMATDRTTPRTSRTTDNDELPGHRGIAARGTEGITIDDILIRRKDQARILEQTLQLLFSAEVLLFVEYMEVFMPLLYAACIGGLWHLPNAKYSVVLMNMTYDNMVLEVGTSLLYAMLEVVSFVSVYFFIKKRYGISALYQLAFLLETYVMTLQGKLIGCFIVILNSSTLHQGIDITFQFDLDKLLKTPNPYTT
jgi:hypothetical protein